MQHITRSSEVISLRLLHVDLLFEIAIDEGMGDIYSASESGANGAQARSGREGVFREIVKARAL